MRIARLAVLCLVLAVAGLVVSVGFGAARSASAEAAREGTPERPFERCLGAASAATTGTAWLELSASDRGDGVSRSRARVSWSEGEGELRVRLQMLAPDEVAGSAILLVEPLEADSEREPAAWAYLPEIDKVRRVGGRHLRKPLFGTNLRYEDLERVRQLALRGEAEAWSELQYAGRAVWRIEGHEGATPITTWLDQERCVPLRTEVADAQGRVLRLVQVSPEPADQHSPHFVPEAVLVRDLRGDSETRVRVEAVDLSVAPPESSFDPAFLGVPAAGPGEPPGLPAASAPAALRKGRASAL